MSFFKAVAHEFAEIGRALKNRDNQILLATVVTVLVAVALVGYGVAHYDHLVAWLMPSMCRDVDNGKIITFMYLGVGFFVAAATLIGSVIQYLKSRDLARRTHRQHSKSAGRQILFNVVLFVVVLGAFGFALFKWC